MKPSVLLDPEQLGDGHIQVSKGPCEGVSCLDVLGLLVVVAKPHLVPTCSMGFALLLMPINWPHQPCRHLDTAPWRVLWGFEHDEFFDLRTSRELQSCCLGQAVVRGTRRG